MMNMAITTHPTAQRLCYSTEEPFSESLLSTLVKVGSVAIITLAVFGIALTELLPFWIVPGACLFTLSVAFVPDWLSFPVWSNYRPIYTSSYVPTPWTWRWNRPKIISPSPYQPFRSIVRPIVQRPVFNIRPVKSSRHPIPIHAPVAHKPPVAPVRPPLPQAPQPHAPVGCKPPVAPTRPLHPQARPHAPVGYKRR